MKLLIISDSHRYSLDIDFSKYDYIIHCGDYGSSLELLKTNNALYVKGNCDLDGNDEIALNINNKKVFITHGNKYNVKYDYERLIYRALEVCADIVFFGHTHNQIAFVEEDILFINPGNYPDFYVEIVDNDIILHSNGFEKHINYRW